MTDQTTEFLLTERRLSLRIREGTYVLIVELKSLARLQVGKLGLLDFPTGWYAYAGNAYGPGGLRARLGHHLRGARRPHWHVDYLRAWGNLQEIWYGRGGQYDEHIWSACLRAMPQAVIVAPGFGSSDCRCETHLVHFRERPDIKCFKRRQPPAAQGARPPIYRMIIDMTAPGRKSRGKVGARASEPEPSGKGGARPSRPSTGKGINKIS